ncbi:oxaloacetate decarboxylase subunit gamma [Pseudidiomarina aestuarii]|uniref:Oxaloacetate decarboxylase gamma chain n=1 Tax=Pseudidiomarina aestuarii TaxID=624146 RepID=A0A7Z6ZT24_9GAMM|nr:OadG family transporter subunit [Pseudidiomarina aestuarii]RUO40727.1 oxaloacetate decarboxylase subunit gamma [Pseudidiomarina aestuarii]
MNEQLNEALAILFTGMVTVFMFLSLLICAMLLLRRFVVEVDVQSAPARKKSKAVSQPTAQQLAAITAAVHRYRGSKS